MMKLSGINKYTSQFLLGLVSAMEDFGSFARIAFVRQLCAYCKCAKMCVGC